MSTICSPTWSAIIVFLGIFLFYSVSSYAVDPNDAKVMKCYNKIDKMEKGLDKQDRHIKMKKVKWAEKARVFLEEAKRYGDNNDGKRCLDFMIKTKNMKKFGYE